MLNDSLIEKEGPRPRYSHENSYFYMFELLWKGSDEEIWGDVFAQPSRKELVELVTRCTQFAAQPLTCHFHHLLYKFKLSSSNLGA